MSVGPLSFATQCWRTLRSKGAEQAVMGWVLSGIGVYAEN